MTVQLFYLMISPTSAKKLASSPPLSIKLLVTPGGVDPKPRGGGGIRNIMFRNDGFKNGLFV